MLVEAEESPEDSNAIHQYPSRILIWALAEEICVRFEVSAAVTMKNAVFWDIKPSSDVTGDILRLRYRAQPVNAM
jgi:hypothetical protein